MYVQYSIKSSMCVLIYVKVLLSIDIHPNQYNYMYILYIGICTYYVTCLCTCVHTYVCVSFCVVGLVWVWVDGWVGVTKALHGGVALGDVECLESC